MAALLKTPVYSKGTYAKLLEALSEGGVFYNLDRICWHVVTEGEYAGQLCLVQPDKSITRMVGNNEELIKRVDSLPSISEARTDALYILNNTVYTFDGMTFYPTYQDVNDDIESMRNSITAFATSIEEMQSAITTLSSDVDLLRDETSTLSDNLGVVDAKANNALEQLINVYTKSEVDESIGDLIDPETGEEVNVKDYVDNAVESAIAIIRV